MTYVPQLDLLQTRCRSLAEECDRIGTLFGLTNRPPEMVRELTWARDTLNILADGISENEDFPLFATLTIQAIQKTRLGAWRTAAAYTAKQAKGK